MNLQTMSFNQILEELQEVCMDLGKVKVETESGQEQLKRLVRKEHALKEKLLERFEDLGGDADEQP